MTNSRPITTRPHEPAGGAQPTCRQPLALLLDVDDAAGELIALWGAQSGWRASRRPSDHERPDALIMQVAYPRQQAADARASAARLWPGVPLVLLSPTILASTPPQGELARELGVAAVLATPLSREPLSTLLARLMPEPRP